MLFEKIGMVDELFEYRADMYVGTEGERITYISDTAPTPERMKAFGSRYGGCGKVLIPGFYNAHGHSPMSLMRGYGENLPLDRWLSELIFPFEAKLYNKAVYWATLLSMAESARYGIVSTTDMYDHIDSIVRAVIESGEKMNVGRAVMNFTGEEPRSLTSYKELVDSIVMYDGFGDGRIKADSSLHAEYTSDEATAATVAGLAEEYELNIHVHVAETRKEAEECRVRHGGKTVVEYLDSVGIFDRPATAAHCVWLGDSDMEILKARGVTVAHCPSSNLKLSSGICDVPGLMKRGVSVALGTDSVSSNNSLDMIAEMKLMAMLGKLKGNDASLMSPREVLYSATRAGALSQGREDCGLIKEGYRADLTVIDTAVPNMQPVHDVMNNLIYSASGKDVVMTMVDGTVLYMDGEYLTMDFEKICAEAEFARNKIISTL